MAPQDPKSVERLRAVADKINGTFDYEFGYLFTIPVSYALLIVQIPEHNTDYAEVKSKKRSVNNFMNRDVHENWNYTGSNGIPVGMGVTVNMSWNGNGTKAVRMKITL